MSELDETLACGRAPSETDFYLEGSSLVFRSPLSRATQAVESPGAAWRCRASWQGLTEAQWRLLSANLARLRGAAVAFQFGPRHARAPVGDSVPVQYFFTDGTGFDDGMGFYDAPYGPVTIRTDADSSAIALMTQGWPAAKAIRRGTYLAVYTLAGERQLVIVVADVIADGAGLAEIAVEPPLRALPEPLSLVGLFWPTTAFRLVDDQQGRMRFVPGIIGDAAVEMTETWGP